MFKVDIDAWPSVPDLHTGATQTLADGHAAADKPLALQANVHQALMTISQNLWRVLHMPRALQVRLSKI